MSDINFINSGSTLLNLALTGHPYRGWPLGRVSNIVGESSAGKTYLAMKACHNFIELEKKKKNFKTYKVYYFDLESAFDMEYAKYLGLNPEEWEMPDILTIEELFDWLENFQEESSKKKDEASLIVIDSFDALSTEEENKADIRKGTYGMRKQKLALQMFRNRVRDFRNLNAHLMILSHLKDNIGASPWQQAHTRSGGSGLDYYSSQILWLTKGKQLKRNGATEPYGRTMNVRIGKNKMSIANRRVEYDLVDMYGIDDISTLIKYCEGDDLNTLFTKKPRSYGLISEDGKEESLSFDKLRDRIATDGNLYMKIIDICKTIWDNKIKESKPDLSPQVLIQEPADYEDGFDG